MKVAVLGDTGMLGSMLKGELYAQGLDVVGYNRSNGMGVEYNADMFKRIETVIDPSVTHVVNCIGAIKPVFDRPESELNAVYTNAVFPRELADWADCKTIWGEGEKKVIHITTDCVFDGADGWYTENSPHNALDNYGKSKSLGEPINCMTLRTSIIGPEWGGNKRSLVEWFLSNRGGEVNGYTNHMWNGVTTLELARCISDIIWNDMYTVGVKHLFSHDTSKFELLLLMNDAWELGIKVNPTEAGTPCNRTLRTIHEMNSILRPQSMSKMFEELRPLIEEDRTANV